MIEWRNLREEQRQGQFQDERQLFAASRRGCGVGVCVGGGSGGGRRRGTGGQLAQAVRRHGVERAEAERWRVGRRAGVALVRRRRRPETRVQVALPARDVDPAPSAQRTCCQCLDSLERLVDPFGGGGVWTPGWQSIW